MKIFSVFLILSGSLISFVSITTSNYRDLMLGLLALALGLLAYKNYK